MDVPELIRKAEEIVEENYSIPVWENMIESVLKDLNSVSKLLKNYTAAVTLTSGAATVAIPSDSYEVVGVSMVPTSGRKMNLRKLSPADSASVGWYRNGDDIVLQNIPYEGSISVDYYELLTITSDEFNLPEKYHEVILKGVLATAMQKEEELNRKQDFFEEYMLAKRTMYAERIIDVEPWLARGAQ
jgi:hypothetical protein